MVGQRRCGARLATLAVVTVLCAAIGACSMLGSRKESNPKVYGLYDEIPEGGGVYKVGEPYQVAGQWFYPQEDRSYDQVGVASWYGEYFHGRRTANGEFYDMNRLSAAHPTLPLPVYARVTNLENGRSLVVRVNDRGPFKRGRIIDLSRGAADELGFVRNGTTEVRVTYITDAPLTGDIPDMQVVDGGYGGHGGAMRAAAADREPFPTGSVRKPTEAPRQASAGSWAGEPVATGAIGGVVPPGKPAPTRILPQGFYVQAASFRSEERARTLAEELARLGVFEVLPVAVGEETFYRVRSGPLASIEDARKTAAGVESAGLGAAQILSR